jgi:hypothetical protein
MSKTTPRSKAEIEKAQHQFMATYKLQKCKDKKPNHDKRMCIYWHSKGDRRRNPFEVAYSPTECSYIGPDGVGNCPDGDACLKAHNMLERMFHPDLYKISMCQKEPGSAVCERGIFCAFAHSEDDLRTHPSVHRAAAARATPPSAASAAPSGVESLPKPSDSKLMDSIQDKLINLIKSHGAEGIISSELPKRFYDMYSERLDLTDAEGERFRIKDILLSHPDIKVEMYKGVQPKYVFREDPSSTPAQAAASKRLILDELLDGPSALSLSSDGSATVPPPPPNAWGLGVPAAVLTPGVPRKAAPGMETSAAPSQLDASEIRTFEAATSFDNKSNDRIAEVSLNRSPGGSRVVGSPSNVQSEPSASQPQTQPLLPFSSMSFASGLGFAPDLGVRSPASLEGEVARMQAELDSKTREALLWSQQYQIVSEQLRLSKESNNSLTKEKNAILEQYHALFAAFQKLRESTGNSDDINQLRTKLSSVELELESARKQLRNVPLGFTGAAAGPMPFGAGIPGPLAPKWDSGWSGLGASHVSEIPAPQPQAMMICALPGCGLPAPQICGNCREVGYCKREHQR